MKVHAEGETTTAGWKYATLVERERSADGSLVVLELAACPPAEFAAEVVSPISADAILQTLEPDRPIGRIEIVAGASRRQLVVDLGQ